MSIKITARKEVRTDTFGYKITGIEALSPGDLPSAYLTGRLSCWLLSDGRLACHRDRVPGRPETCHGCRILFALGVFMSEKIFNERINFVKSCGKRLKEVREAEAAKNWKGTVEVTI